MARGNFGGSAADFVFQTTTGGLLRLAAATLTLWDAEVGGNQVTDLLLGGQPATAIPVGSDGMIPTFQGPDNVTLLWASAGGARVLLISNQTITAQALADKVDRGLVDAKGDLLVGSAADTLVRLAVGANGRVLVADSAQAGGVAWSATGRLEGAGSPEGAVAAPVGSTYVDTAATNGAALWVKASGVGTTGWRVAQGDTGWRDVSGLLVNGWTGSGGAAGVKIRREGSTVWLSVRSLDAGAATAAQFLGAIAGFNAPNLQGGLVLFGSGSVRSVTSTTSGITCSSTAAGVGAANLVTWTTNEAWPAALPGSATT